MKTLLNKDVEIASDIRTGTGVVALSAGQQGRVVWDEPDGDVIVEFEHDVSQANGGHLPNKRQAWVSRNLVSLI